MMEIITLFSTIKEKWLVPIALASLAYLAPIHSMLIVVGILIFGDMILGIWAALKRGEEISSSRLRDTVSKMFIYHLVLILGFLVQNDLFQGLIPVAKLSASVIGMVEIKSVFENASEILGRPIFKDVIKKLGSKNRD